MLNSIGARTFVVNQEASETQVRVNIRSVANAAKVRRETRHGRAVIIVPSATLPDNVVMNGILYPAEEIEKSYMGLERTPAPLGHPVVNGKLVSARDPLGINIGYIGAHNENVRREGGRVLMDKVIDVEVANRCEGGKKVLAAIEAGGPIHTSTGLLAKLTPVSNAGTHKQVARSYAFDHDAILLDEPGAATPDQGVGMLVNPRQAALEIVGRINRATGRREGGILGLTQAQAAYVATAREELASGDPEALKHYLTRGRRDKRFDRSVTKAIREGKPVDPAIAAKALTAYERRLLQLRGETIGRVEAMTSLQQAKHEAYRQAIASGKVAENTVTKVWRSAGDLRVRHTHRSLNAESVRFSEAFRSPSGAMMRFPMDTSMGAGPQEIVGCRCDCEYRIDFYANLR